MKKKLMIALIFITATLLIWFLGIVRLGEQSPCEANEILACCSLYEDNVCYISSDKVCLTDYDIKCVPRHNNYPVMKPKP